MADNSRERSRSPRRDTDDTEAKEKTGMSEEDDHASTGTRESETPRFNVGIVKIPVYTKIDPTSWSFKSLKQQGVKNEKQISIMIQDVQDKKPIFCLYQEGDPVNEIVYPLQPYGDELPSFMTGAPPSRSVERLDLNISLEGEQFKFVAKIDEIVKKSLFDNSKEWFGIQLSEQEIEICYSSPVKIDEEGKYKPKLRTKIALAGIDKYLTEVTFIDIHKNTQRGSGWAFVEAKLGETKWRGYKTRCVVQPRLWVVSRKKYGLSYEITELAIKEKEIERGSQFEKDDTLRAAFADC